MKLGVAGTVIALTLLGHTVASSQDVQQKPSRYPYRLPEWIWDVPSTQHLLPVTEVEGIKKDIEHLDKIKKDEARKDEAEKLPTAIARRLASKFTSRDISTGAFLANNPETGAFLAVRFDPEFGAENTKTLQAAVAQFLTVALDAAVIEQALSHSTAKPKPEPEKYEKKNDAVSLDKLMRPIFSEEQGYMLMGRVRPYSARSFATHLKSALSTETGEPRVLVISSFSGRVEDSPWWGRGKYDFLSDPSQQLQRESPPEGYLYIALNTDKFETTSPGWNEPNFWASKMAHEILHNLGYWHPPYKTPEERDKNNYGDQHAFIVSYEQAILERLNALK
jgi:hypothetical protein